MAVLSRRADQFPRHRSERDLLAAGLHQTDPIIQLYRLDTGQELGQLPACWRFAPESDAIITCEIDGSVTRWEGSEFEERQILLHVGDGLASAALSDDCSTIAASFTSGSIRVWSLNQASLRREFKAESARAAIWGFAADSNRLLVINEQDRSLHEWDLRTGAERKGPLRLADWRIYSAYPGEARHRQADDAAKLGLDAVP